MHKTLSFLVLVLAPCLPLSAQQSGCTDPQAINFSNTALINNGSCTYNTTKYYPSTLNALSGTLKEISGLIFFDGKLFGLNDGGNPNAIYRIDTLTGNVLQTITLMGTLNIDWEDIAQDSSHIYIGDFGNNASRNRNNLVIYKFPKSTIASDTVTMVPADSITSIHFSYSDQTDFSPQGANNTRFDCEAMVYARGKLHLFSKNWISGTTVHYSLDNLPGKYIAQRLDSMDTHGYMITGVDAGAYDELLMTGYDKSGRCVLYLVYGFDDTDYFLTKGNKRNILLPLVTSMGQLEAVAFVNPTHGLMAGEAFSFSVINYRQKMHAFNIENLITDYYRHNVPQYAVPGMFRFNAETDQFEWFDSSIWQILHSGLGN